MISVLGVVDCAFGAWFGLCLVLPWVFWWCVWFEFSWLFLAVGGLWRMGGRGVLIYFVVIGCVFRILRLWFEFGFWNFWFRLVWCFCVCGV